MVSRDNQTPVSIVQELLFAVLGHKQIFALEKTMSALPTKADICSAKWNLRFGSLVEHDSRNFRYLLYPPSANIVRHSEWQVHFELAADIVRVINADNAPG
jgi:hypothetical protein